MEGPSLFLAKEQLKSFKKKVVISVSGNTRIDKGRFEGQTVKDIFSWGKHLLFQFDGFALKVHFLLFRSPLSQRYYGSIIRTHSKSDHCERLELEASVRHLQAFVCRSQVVCFFHSMNLKTFCQ